MGNSDILVDNNTCSLFTSEAASVGIYFDIEYEARNTRVNTPYKYLLHSTSEALAINVSFNEEE